MNIINGINEMCADLTETTIDFGIRTVGILGATIETPDGKQTPLRFTIVVEPPVFGKTAYPTPDGELNTSVVDQLKRFEKIEESKA